MTEPSRDKRKTFLRYLPWLAGVLLAVVAAWYFTRPKPIEVELVKVERAGTVKACRRAKLSAPSGGQISHLLVKKGQRVKANQVLLELWDKDLQAQEQLAQEQLATAQTQAHQACVQADLAEKEADRARQLKESGFISAEGLDQKVSAAKVARAGCKAANSQIEQSRSRIAVARASLQRMVLRAACCPR
jgi:HlyD family secretion protein